MMKQVEEKLLANGQSKNREPEFFQRMVESEKQQGRKKRYCQQLVAEKEECSFCKTHSQANEENNTTVGEYRKVNTQIQSQAKPGLLSFSKSLKRYQKI